MEKGHNMNKHQCILLDELYKESQTSLSFEFHKRVDDDDAIYYFTVVGSFENMRFYTELALFDSDIEKLKAFKCKSPVSEIHFIEPDVTFTIIKRGRHDISVYVNIDSGLRFSNIVSESGCTIKINVSRKTFYQFIKEIIAVQHYE
ncbi:hypothetical protein ACFDHU_01320 [Staphylococcus hyicus]